MQIQTFISIFSISALIGLQVPPAMAHVIDSQNVIYSCKTPIQGADQDSLTDIRDATALVEELFKWIESNTDYDTRFNQRQPPGISFCITGTSIKYEGRLINVEEDLRAMYDLRKRLIYIVLPWSADSPRDVSVLLHELIHDVQLHTKDWECTQAPEWEAYKLQDQWLAERDVESGFDWFTIHLLSRCPKGIHP